MMMVQWWGGGEGGERVVCSTMVAWVKASSLPLQPSTEEGDSVSVLVIIIPCLKRSRVAQISAL